MSNLEKIINIKEKYKEKWKDKEYKAKVIMTTITGIIILYYVINLCYGLSQMSIFYNRLLY